MGNFLNKRKKIRRNELIGEPASTWALALLSEFLCTVTFSRNETLPNICSGYLNTPFLSSASPQLLLNITFKPILIWDDKLILKTMFNTSEWYGDLKNFKHKKNNIVSFQGIKFWITITTLFFLSVLPIIWIWVSHSVGNLIHRAPSPFHHRGHTW